MDATAKERDPKAHVEAERLAAQTVMTQGLQGDIEDMTADMHSVGIDESDIFADDEFDMLHEKQVDTSQLFIPSKNPSIFDDADAIMNDTQAQQYQRELMEMLGGKYMPDDPVLQPDARGRYANVRDPLEPFDPDEQRSVGRTYGNRVDPDEEFFYPDFLNFNDKFPEISQEQANRLLPLRSHGPDLDDFLEAHLEHPSKYALITYENKHPESRREPRPLWYYGSRKNPSIEWIESHKGFIYAEGMDATLSLGDQEAFRASFDVQENDEHRRKVAEKFAKVFRVDIGHVSPATLTSAYIGYSSLADAQRALKRLQGKIVQYKPVQAARLSDVTELVSLLKKNIEELDNEDELQLEKHSFLEDSDPQCVILLTHLEIPTQEMGTAYLLQNLFPESLIESNKASPLSPEDLLVLSPTAALIRLPSSEAVTELLESKKFALLLKKMKPPKQLSILKAARERVFCGWSGLRRSKEMRKNGKLLIVEGDVPSDSFFRSHFGVLYLNQLSSDVTAKDISQFFQRYCLDSHDSISSVEMIKTSDGRFMKQAFIGFDKRGEAEKALEDWNNRSALEKKILGGNLVQLLAIRDKKIPRPGPLTQPRSERNIDELLDDLHNWEKHVVNPKLLEELYAFGIDKSILDDVFMKIRFQNRSFGVLDLERKGDKLENDRPSGSRYAQFVNMYVKILRESITTPDHPGPVVESMFAPDENVNLDLIDGPRPWPANLSELSPPKPARRSRQLNDY